MNLKPYFLSDIKEKLSNINNNSKKDTKEKMASSIATSQSQAPQGDFNPLKSFSTLSL